MEQSRDRRARLRYPEWAVRYAQQAVELEPGNAFDRVTLAGLFSRLDRHKEALSHFLIASEMDEFREVGLSASLIIMMEHPEVVTPQLKSATGGASETLDQGISGESGGLVVSHQAGSACRYRTIGRTHPPIHEPGEFR